jgi:AAA15 family ATPase/GTPase
MLVSFSVANFRSFSTEQLLSLAASKQLGEQHAAHVVPIGAGDGGVLRTGVIYGANASGRSSLHKALSFVKDVALLPRRA